MSENVLTVYSSLFSVFYFSFFFHVWKLVGFSLCAFIQKSLVDVPGWVSASIVQGTSRAPSSWKLRSLALGPGFELILSFLFFPSSSSFFLQLLLLAARTGSLITSCLLFESVEFF